LIIVTGNYRVPPEERDRFMGSKQDQVARTRQESGCLEYAYSADAHEPGLVRSSSTGSAWTICRPTSVASGPIRRLSRTSRWSARPSRCFEATPTSFPRGDPGAKAPGVRELVPQVLLDDEDNPPAADPADAAACSNCWRLTTSLGGGGTMVTGTPVVTEVLGGHGGEGRPRGVE